MVSARHNRQHIFLLLIFLGMIILGFMLGEMTVRFLGTADADGNFQVTMLNHTLEIEPFHLPIQVSKELLDQYRSQPSYLMYDPTLGWVPRPRGISQNGLNRANDQGIRRGSIDDSTRSAKEDLRIILLGDSYTHGDEISFEETWGYYLEKELARMGIQADVINLGVPAYGMDQALLRWKIFGVKFSPDLVIFGFQPENVKRNLNLFRMIYHKPSAMPFSKPRFILSGDHLKAINMPTVPPDQIVEVLMNFDKWENQQYEYYYHIKDYEDSLWFKSKLLGALHGGITRLWYLWDDSGEREFYEVDREPGSLALTILDELRSDVERRGAAFLVALLIPKWDFHYVNNARPFPYQDLLEVLEQKYDTIETATSLFHYVKDGNDDQLFAQLHYSAKGNELIADVIAEVIAARSLIASCCSSN